jgi:hypothetical protein
VIARLPLEAEEGGASAGGWIVGGWEASWGAEILSQLSSWIRDSHVRAMILHPWQMESCAMGSYVIGFLFSVSGFGGMGAR